MGRSAPSVVFFLFFILGSPDFCRDSALGHGDHGDAAPLAGLASVTVAGYEVEFLARPVPLVVGQENKLVAKILEPGKGKGVGGGKLFIQVEPLDQQGSAPGLAGYQLAREEVWAGSYTITVSFQKAGTYRARVAIYQLGGQLITPPVKIDFLFKVEKGGLTPGLLFLFAVALGMAAVGLYAVAARARHGPSHPSGFNLLDIPWIKKLFRWRYFQPAFQIPLLAVTALVVYLGLADVQEAGKNLATKLTWTIWWAGVIFTFILVGRLWCLMCPFGALNEWPARLAWPRRRFPRLVRNLWLATLGFILLTWADEQLNIVRSPAVTAWLVIFFAALAVAIGLFFQRRSFCRHLCPIGGLIGIYSMISPLELRAKEQELCRACKTKDCYRGNERGYGCPMFEFPQVMDRNNCCNLCGECVKTCPQDNIALRFRPFGKDIWSTKKRHLDEAYLATSLVGITAFVSLVMLSSWLPWMVALGKLLPVNLIQYMKPVTFFRLWESGLFLVGSLVLVPGLVWLATYVGRRSAGSERRETPNSSFVLFAYMFIPVGLAMHLAHNLMHLLIEGPGIIPVIQRTVLEFTPFNLGTPNWDIGPLAPAAVVHWMQLGLVLLFLAYTLYAGYRLSASTMGNPASWRRLLPVVGLALAFTLVNLFLLSQHMTSRHA